MMTVVLIVSILPVIEVKKVILSKYTWTNRHNYLMRVRKIIPMRVLLVLKLSTLAKILLHLFSFYQIGEQDLVYAFADVCLDKVDFVLPAAQL